MRTQSPKLWQFWGWNSQGNIGPWTCYTGKRRQLVIFLTKDHEKPSSYLRDRTKNRIRAAAHGWRMLTNAQRERWALAAERANLRISGYNLWTFWFMKRDRATIRTIERISKVSLNIT